MRSLRRLTLPGVVALVVGAQACLLVTDFDVRSAAGGASSSGANSGGSGGAGGRGTGGGGASCKLPGDGPSGAVAPWSIALGPFAGLSGGFGLRHPRVKVALVGDKVAVGVVGLNLSTGGGRPVMLGGRQVAGPESAFVVGWVDDGGADSDAWTLSSITPITNDIDGPSLDVAAWKPGKVLVSAADGANRVALVELDLCTRAERVLMTCEGLANAALRVPSVDADAAADRIVFGLNTAGVLSCVSDAAMPDCPLPGGIGPTVFSIEGTTKNGVCRAMSLPGALAAMPHPGPDGELFVAGGYVGSVSLGPITVRTYCDTCGCTCKCDGSCGIDPVACGACDTNTLDSFFARFEPSGPHFQAARGFDLGAALIGASVEVPQIVAVGGSGDAVVAMTPFPRNPSPIFPDPGWVFPATSLATSNASDVVIARVPPTGPAVWSEFLNQGGWDINGQLTRSEGKLVLAGRTNQSGGVLADCADKTNGCAFFLPIDSEATGGLGKAVLLDSTAPDAMWGGDQGLAGWVTSEGDFLIAASVDGAVSLDHVIDAPPAHDLSDKVYFVNIVFARVPAPK